jgi:hypothetical protein
MAEQAQPERPPAAAAARLSCQPPRLTRWGKLTELTAGGGGKKSEPSLRKTRF